MAASSKAAIVRVSDGGETGAKQYVFTDDGNFGDYAALLNRLDLALTISSFSSADPNCQLYAAVAGAIFANDAQATVASSLRQNLQSTTIGQSVCPLPP